MAATSVEEETCTASAPTVTGKSYRLGFTTPKNILFILFRALEYFCCPIVFERGERLAMAEETA